VTFHFTRLDTWDEMEPDDITYVTSILAYDLREHFWTSKR
jgi:hypothetical protein